MERKELEIELINSTRNAERILAFAKNTRLLGENEKNIYSATIEEVMRDVDYSLNTIRGPLEFIHYIFLIKNASRAFTHQLVRHRINSYAQQSLRVSDNFNYHMPEEIEIVPEAKYYYEKHMVSCKDYYEIIKHFAINMQDARGILPLNTTSAILVKMNLRSALELFEKRLCLRSSGEFQKAAKLISKEIIKVHPWTEKVIGPHCLVHSKCLFPKFDKCPISKAVPELKGFPEETKDKIKELYESNKCRSIQPEVK